MPHSEQRLRRARVWLAQFGHVQVARSIVLVVLVVLVALMASPSRRTTAAALATLASDGRKLA